MPADLHECLWWCAVFSKHGFVYCLLGSCLCQLVFPPLIKMTGALAWDQAASFYRLVWLVWSVLLETSRQIPPLPLGGLIIHQFPFPSPLLTFHTNQRHQQNLTSFFFFFKKAHKENVSFGVDAMRLRSWWAFRFLVYKNSSRMLATKADLLINDCPWGHLVCDMNDQTYCTLTKLAAGPHVN